MFVGRGNLTAQLAAKTITLNYLKTIGLTNNQPTGRGFSYPYDMSLSSDARMFVLSRARNATRIQICNFEEEWLGEFTGPGDHPFGMPVSMAFDDRDLLYVTDDALNEIKVFDSEGNFVRRWGVKGDGDGEMDGPAGIAIGKEGNLYVVDQRNNRVQKFTPDGAFILNWGKKGPGESQLNLPWGVALDSEGNVYVADWRNDRVQKFTSDGGFLAVFGRSGDEDGQFHRPSGVAVDDEGFIYVADWGNERVQALGPDGSFQLKLLGEATLSKWAQEWLEVNRDELEARNRSQLLVGELPEHLRTPYHIASQTEPYFWGPVSVKLDDENRLYVTEHSRHRIQVYQKA